MRTFSHTKDKMDEKKRAREREREIQKAGSLCVCAHYFRWFIAQKMVGILKRFVGATIVCALLKI